LSAVFDLDFVFRTAGHASGNCDFFEPKSNFNGAPHRVVLLILNA
jgi:hypothetical protein